MHEKNKNAMVKPGDIIKIIVCGWGWKTVGGILLKTNLSWSYDNNSIGIIISENYLGLPFKNRIKYWDAFLFKGKFVRLTNDIFEKIELQN